MKGFVAFIVVVVVGLVLMFVLRTKGPESQPPAAPVATQPETPPASGSAALAAQSNPNVGKAAPTLKVKEWVTGGAITPAELTGKPYVIEFWATWCPPCRVSIPHLNELTLRVQPFGLNVIGLSKEDVAVVRPFAEKMNMRYHVGIDDGTSGLTFEGIPFAAVIGGNGKVVWAGHPLHPGFEDALFSALREFCPTLDGAVVLAREGKLGEAYAVLEKLGTPEARAAQEAISADAGALWGRSAREAGLAQYKLVEMIAGSYAGLPEAVNAKAKLVTLKTDPAVARAMAEQDASDELEKQINALGKTAEEKQRAKVPDTEIRKDFFAAVIALFTDFVTKNPAHPRTPSLKKDIDGMTAELAQLNAVPVAKPANPPPLIKR